MLLYFVTLYVYGWAVNFLAGFRAANDVNDNGTREQVLRIANWQPPVAEAVAMLRGISLAIEMGLAPFVIETNALVNKGFKKGKSDKATGRVLVIEEILSLLSLGHLCCSLPLLMILHNY
ncbi:hypothetical protein LWI28_025469 [Acer negundo]|uniref:Uncharacterized protein n=1 Tax=Acer negundo TaxID=4023 RepID=A0AAD5JFA6_ACENE|nr:hypothetical protein LWI28_025469 [Acer negundo]